MTTTQIIERAEIAQYLVLCTNRSDTARNAAINADQAADAITAAPFLGEPAPEGVAYWRSEAARLRGVAELRNV